MYINRFTSCSLKTVIQIVFCFLLIACENYTEKSSLKKVEVQQRMTAITANSDQFPKLKIGLRLQSECDKILLLSKDIENPRAACELGNSLFSSYADSIGMDQEYLVLLNAQMDKQLIAEAIYANQLQLLTSLIAKQAPSITIAPASVKD